MLDRLTLANFILYMGHHGLRLLFPLIATPYLAHTLHRDAFAELALINSCLWTSTVFMEFGFYLYGVSRSASAADRDELTEVVSAITAAKAALAPVTAAVYLGLIAWSGLANDRLAVSIGLVGAIAAGGSFAWYFQGQQRGLIAVAVEAVPQALQFGLMLLFVRAPDQLWLAIGLQSLPAVTSLAYSLVAIGGAGLLRRPKPGEVLKVMREASPFFAQRLCFTLYTAFTPAIIFKLGDKTQVAFYSVGERIGALLTTLVAPLGQAAVPMISRTVRESGEGWRTSVALIGLATLAIGGAAALVYLFTSEILRSLFPPDFAPAAPVIQIFCLSGWISGIGFAIINFVLAPRGQVRILAWGGLLAVFLGLFTQVLLTPNWGAPGAAVGRLIAEALVTVLVGAASLRLYLRTAPAHPFRRQARGLSLPRGADPEFSRDRDRNTAKDPIL